MTLESATEHAPGIFLSHFMCFIVDVSGIVGVSDNLVDIAK